MSCGPGSKGLEGGMRGGRVMVQVNHSSICRSHHYRQGQTGGGVEGREQRPRGGGLCSEPADSRANAAATAGCSGPRPGKPGQTLRMKIHHCSGPCCHLLTQHCTLQ